jgi:hypothetical protein
MNHHHHHHQNQSRWRVYYAAFSQREAHRDERWRGSIIIVSSSAHITLWRTREPYLLLLLLRLTTSFDHHRQHHVRDTLATSAAPEADKRLWYATKKCQSFTTPNRGTPNLNKNDPSRHQAKREAKKRQRDEQKSQSQRNRRKNPCDRRQVGFSQAESTCGVFEPKRLANQYPRQ